MASEWSDELLAVAKGFRNGVVYGAKIRLPHALVMTMLFRTGSWESKARAVVRLTVQHAWALGRFVALYKAALAILRRLGAGRDAAPFAAGALGGYAVFSDSTAVNTQIVLYLLGRAATALLRLSGVDSAWPRESWAVQASVIWGVIMWLHARHADTLQPSLRSSMKYLYEDSDAPPADLWSFLFDSGAK